MEKFLLRQETDIFHGSMLYMQPVSFEIKSPILQVMGTSSYLGALATQVRQWMVQLNQLKAFLAAWAKVSI